MGLSDFELSESSGSPFWSNDQSEEGHLVSGSMEVVAVTW